ncbi:GPI anchored serine-threonine rich protein [Penicillium paradoxum]|uniref:GPI anchored serine-threonine rich protein n=1 Tax=Penicillium paradoxum TaxID=176176 RepID=UPI002546769E|nr:GPI anchored serine-threonine rich protein [Penicillium paradoxum]KAJ5794350.1 GPI anchored serine-threonine rich protein [Penicillium paradoxum]
MVNCYKDCPDDPSRVYAESTRQQKCARTKPSVRISTPALAMRSGAASVIPSASATAGASRALATETSNNDEDNDGSNSDADDDFNEGVPTKSYSGLEANSIASLKEGSASDIKALTWVSLLGLGVAVLF